MDCCWVNCTGHAAETAHVLVPCCCFHAVGFLEVWDLIARCCCFHAVGSLKVANSEIHGNHLCAV